MALKTNIIITSLGMLICIQCVVMASADRPLYFEFDSEFVFNNEEIEENRQSNGNFPISVYGNDFGFRLMCNGSITPFTVYFQNISITIFYFTNTTTELNRTYFTQNLGNISYFNNYYAIKLKDQPQVNTTLSLVVKIWTYSAHSQGFRLETITFDSIWRGCSPDDPYGCFSTFSNYTMIILAIVVFGGLIAAFFAVNRMYKKNTSCDPNVSPENFYYNPKCREERNKYGMW